MLIGHKIVRYKSGTSRTWSIGRVKLNCRIYVHFEFSTESESIPLVSMKRRFCRYVGIRSEFGRHFFFFFFDIQLMIA